MSTLLPIGKIPPPTYLGASASESPASLKPDRQLRALYRLLHNAPFDEARITRREKKAFFDVIEGQADLVWLFNLLDRDDLPRGMESQLIALLAMFIQENFSLFSTKLTNTSYLEPLKVIDLCEDVLAKTPDRKFNFNLQVAKAFLKHIDECPHELEFDTELSAVVQRKGNTVIFSFHRPITTNLPGGESISANELHFNDQAQGVYIKFEHPQEVALPDGNHIDVSTVYVEQQIIASAELSEPRGYALPYFGVISLQGRVDYLGTQAQLVTLTEPQEVRVGHHELYAKSIHFTPEPNCIDLYFEEPQTITLPGIVDPVRAKEMISFNPEEQIIVGGIVLDGAQDLQLESGAALPATTIFISHAGQLSSFIFSDANHPRTVELPTGDVCSVVKGRFDENGEILSITARSDLPITHKLPNGESLELIDASFTNGKITRGSLLKPQEITLPDGSQVRIHRNIKFNEAGEIIEYEKVPRHRPPNDYFPSDPPPSPYEQRIRDPRIFRA